MKIQTDSWSPSLGVALAAGVALTLSCQGRDREAQAVRSPLAVNQPAFVAVSVSDLEESVAWYARVLELQTVRTVEARSGWGRAVLLQRGELTIELIEYGGSVSPLTVDSTLSHRFAIQGLVKAGLFVDNVDRWHTELQTEGVSVDDRVGVDEVLGARTFVFRDPDSNRIQVFAPCAGDCA